MLSIRRGRPSPAAASRRARPLSRGIGARSAAPRKSRESTANPPAPTPAPPPPREAPATAAPGPVAAAPTADGGAKGGGILAGARGEEDGSDARLRKRSEIGPLVARIGGEILGRPELLRVDEQRGADPVALAAGRRDQRQV